MLVAQNLKFGESLCSFLFSILLETVAILRESFFPGTQAAFSSAFLLLLKFLLLSITDLLVGDGEPLD